MPLYANNVVSTLTIIVQRRTDNILSRRQVYIRTRSEVSFTFIFSSHFLETKKILFNSSQERDGHPGVLSRR